MCCPASGSVCGSGLGRPLPVPVSCIKSCWKQLGSSSGNSRLACRSSVLKGLVNLLPALDLVTFISLFLLLVYSYLDLVIGLWMLCHDAGLETYMWLHPGLSLGFTQLLEWIRDAILIHVVGDIIFHTDCALSSLSN